MTVKTSSAQGSEHFGLIWFLRCLACDDGECRLTKKTKQFFGPAQTISFVYGYDQVLIVCKQTAEELESVLPVERLEKLSSTFQISSKVSDEAWKFGYRAWIKFVNPSVLCLRLLRKHKKHLKHYAIIRVEIAKDTPVGCLADGDVCVDMMNRITCKRWGKESKCYRQEEHKQDAHLFADDKGSITSYFDPYKQFAYVIYSRLSKFRQLRNNPCIHLEFILKGSRNIEKKLRVKTIGDLLKINIKEQYELLEAKYIYYEDFDFSEDELLKLGKQLTGIHGNTVIAKKPDESFSSVRGKMTDPFIRMIFIATFYLRLFPTKMEYKNHHKKTMQLPKDKRINS